MNMMLLRGIGAHADADASGDPLLSLCSKKCKRAVCPARTMGTRVVNEATRSGRLQ
jgi:hypothetical protein